VRASATAQANVCVKENVVGYQIMQNNKDTVEQSNWSFFPLYAITVLPG
jgi:hypothetical protein